MANDLSDVQAFLELASRVQALNALRFALRTMALAQMDMSKLNKEYFHGTTQRRLYCHSQGMIPGDSTPNWLPMPMVRR